MADLTEIGTSEVDITDPARICSKHGHMADPTEISGKDGHTTNLTHEGDQALPRRGPSSEACSWLPLRGSQDEDQDKRRRLGGRRAVSRTLANRSRGGRTVSKKSTHSSRRTEAMDQQGPTRRRRLDRDFYTVLDKWGTLWRERRSRVAGDTANMYITIPPCHKWSSGAPSTLHHILLAITSHQSILSIQSARSCNIVDCFHRSVCVVSPLTDIQRRFIEPAVRVTIELKEVVHCGPGITSSTSQHTGHSCRCYQQHHSHQTLVSPQYVHCY